MTKDFHNLKEKRYCANISITAYRAIKILMLLIDRPYSSAELTEILKNDEITCRSTSDDTLRVTINSLKAVGCEISRPTPKNEYKYILTNHPFKTQFTEKHFTILNKIRKSFLLKNDWQTVLKLNDLYDKLADFTGQDNIKNLVNHKKPFSNIKPEVRELLLSGEISDKEIVMTYSNRKKSQNIENIITGKIFCESGRIYIWAWNYKYNTYSYFNAEKILNIHSIKRTKNSPQPSEYKVLYKVLGQEIKTFECREEERILKADKNSITVEYSVINEFKFFQRLLSMGEDFEIIEPDFARQKLFEKLTEIEKRYL